MGFYEQISKYYDYIFPAGKSQVSFIKQSAGAPPARILDVACGSGEYSVELAREGYRVTAIDLDGEMVRSAKEKAAGEGLNITVLKLNMLEIQKTFDNRFDCIFCIGNSIVHLGSLDEITKALKQMYVRLADNGSLILQVINYDRVLKYHVNELPAIKDEEIGLEFIRKYEYDRNKDVIYFNTVLSVGAGDNGKTERFENSIELLPLMSDDMMRVLKEAGFEEIQFYGDFTFSPYNDNSYMLVVKARK